MGLKSKGKKKPSVKPSEEKAVSNIKQNWIQSASLSMESFQSRGEIPASQRRGGDNGADDRQRGEHPRRHCRWVFPSNPHCREAILLGNRVEDSSGLKEGTLTSHCRRRNRRASVIGQNLRSEETGSILLVEP